MHDLSKLRGHKLIVVNSSFYKVPFADFLIFADTRWWDEHHPQMLKIFPGRIVSVSSLCRHNRLLRMKRKLPPCLANDGVSLVIKYTTTASAINLAVYLGVA